MPTIDSRTLGAIAPYVRSTVDGYTTYNAEHVVRLKRHVIRMLRARPEDDFDATVLGHLWDGARIVALAWGYVPTLTTQMVALRELQAERRAEAGAWPRRRFRGGRSQCLELVYATLNRER